MTNADQNAQVAYRQARKYWTIIRMNVGKDN